MAKQYLLYSDCILIDGANIAAIYDLTRNKIVIVPKSLHNILKEYGGFPFSLLKKIYIDETDTIYEYLEFLLKHEFIFETSNSEIKFDNLSFSYNTYNLIDNIIIDSDIYSSHNYEKIAIEIEKTECKSLFLRLYDDNNTENIASIISHFSCNIKLNNIIIMIPYKHDILDEIKENILKFGQVCEVIIHSSPSNRSINYKMQKIRYINEIIKNEMHCGKIYSSKFSINIKMFLENKNFNSCLHKKISIDKRGNIKNCPSCEKSYGKIGEVSLINIAKSEEFQEIWFLNKDHIKVCKDCVYRYACHDCRAYLSQKEDIYSKPAKCNYNPYKK
jgi:SPASM domain peptide maturase of grasp-with-spasm system